MSGQASALGWCGLMEDLAYLLGAVVGDFDTNMRLMRREGCVESFLLTLREPITRGAQEIADLIEGIPLASTVAQCILLDTVAYPTWGVASEFDDMKGVQHTGCVLGAGHQWRSYIPGRDPASRFALPRESLFRARPASSCTRCQTCPAPGPTSGPWDDPSRVSGPRCR